MRFILSAMAATFLSVAVQSSNSQTPQVPIAQAPAIPVKMAIINTDAFTDTKSGIKRLINAYAQIDADLAPKRQDIVNKNNRYQALVQKAGAGTLTQAEADEADTLKRVIQRAQEDGQREAEKLTRQRINPILAEIGNAIQAYSRGRGFDIVFDVSKFQGSVLVINQGVDITHAFIADFNTKNP